MISFIGMRTQEVKAQQVLNIVLKTESEMIDEVMVVAYGTAKKSSFTGSAASVDGKKIAKLQVASVSKALEGAAAGVTVVSTSGQPGDPFF